jgi:hypothetical protein
MSRHQAVSQLHFFAFILDTLFSDPDCDISDFIGISPNELEELWAWNTPMHPDLRVCHHEMISKQAAKQQEKNAIEAWDGIQTGRRLL